MIIGPAGKSINSEIYNPIAEIKMPIMTAINLNIFRFLEKLRLAVAGIATKAAVKSPPTNFMPKPTASPIKIK